MVYETYETWQYVVGWGVLLVTAGPIAAYNVTQWIKGEKK